MNTIDSPRTGAVPLGIGWRHFWRWWTGELAEWVPTGWRPAARMLDEATFILVNGGRVLAKRYMNGRMQGLGELDLSKLPNADQPVALKNWLAKVSSRPDQMVLLIDALCKTFELPRAAEENLRQVIAYELDRFTPFKAGDVYFDYRILKPGLGRQTLKVEIAVAPQNQVDPPLGLLANAGVRPVAVVAESDLRPERLPLNLLPAKNRAKRGPRLSPLNMLLAGVATILLATSLGLPIWKKQQAIEAIAPQVERARRAAENAGTLQQALDRGVREYNLLLQRKQSYPAAVVALDELTRILADGTWLEQLDMRSHPGGWEVLIQGETTISSKLVGIIDNSPLFRDSSFKAPLVKGQAPSSERFQLGAELEGLALPATLPIDKKRPPPPAASPGTPNPAAGGSVPGAALPAPGAMAPATTPVVFTSAARYLISRAAGG